MRSWDRPGILLYGPYWKLPRGTYRLEAKCSAIHVRHGSTIFCGLEVLVQNRTFLAVADYALDDMTDGTATLVFSLPVELSSEGGNEATVEFRFLHYGGARYQIAEMNLVALPDEAVPALSPLRWRLSSRLRRRWLSKSLSIEPALKLPEGAYTLSFKISPRRHAVGSAGPLEVAISVGDHCRARRKCSVASEAPSLHTLDFDVPIELAFDRGASERLNLTLNGGGRRAVDLDDMVLTQNGSATASQAATHPAIIDKAPIRVVVIGNCQAELLTEGLRHLRVSDRVSVRYHFVGLASNLHEGGRSDLGAATHIFAQDIPEWATYPLVSEILPSVEIHRFPMLRFATPWPFDAYNGSIDSHAARREATDPYFPNLDGVLGRLRHQVPDVEARFRAYRLLDFEHAPDPLKLARFEERRLALMDKNHESSLGAHILENFRKRPVFHSIGHPGGDLLTHLLQHVGKLAGLSTSRVPAATMNQLRNIQVPVHPVVAQRLGMRWADERTCYEFRGEKITWETYVRRYIHHFG